MTVETVFKDLKPGDKFIIPTDSNRSHDGGMLIYVKLDPESGFALFHAVSLKTGRACHVPAPAEDLRVIRLDL